MLIICGASRLRIVNELVAAGNELDAVVVGLFQGATVPNWSDTKAIYTAAIATFTGYAVSGVIVWTGGYLTANGIAYVLGGLKLFPAAAAVPPAVFVPNTVTGYYMYRVADLVGAEQFTDANGAPAPVGVTNEFSVVPVIPRFSFGQ